MQTRRLFTLPRLLTAERPIHTAALLAPALCLGACVADDVDPAAMGGSGGSGTTVGGSAGQTGNTGGGGGTAMGGGGGSGGATGGIMDNPDFGRKIPCVAPMPPETLLMDFTPVAAAADAGAADAGAAAAVADWSFGDYTTTFSGGTYVYPTGGGFPVTSDVTGGSWHITGAIGDYSGFGIYFGGTVAGEECNVIDLDAYDGISFTISGNVEMAGMITMTVATAGNNASHLYLNTVAMPPPAMPVAVNSGRCIPPGANQYDGSCAAAAAAVTVSAAPATVTMLWSDFMAGRPEATVNPSEITGIAWAFPAPPGAGNPAAAMPYDVDIVLDDIRFVDSP